MNISKNMKLINLALMFLLLAISTGCSQPNGSLGNGSSSQSVNIDPLEKVNRGVFKFNQGLDKHLLKPVAKAYKAVTPRVVNVGITNFFHNLGDVGNIVNNALQLKLGAATSDTGRVLVNSTIGLAGLFDVATGMGMERHKEDFGQTLANLGFKSGPYIMLPVLGPTTFRDATAKFTVDTLLNPANYTKESLSLFVLEKLDKRADYLGADDAFNDLSDDLYDASRDLWLQRRDFLIRDGKGEESEQLNLIDDLESLDDE